MYIVALIRILVTEIFPGNILNVKHGCHRAGNVQGKNFCHKNSDQGREKSGNFTSSQGKFYGHIIIILFMKLNNKLIVGFQKSLSFLHVIVKELHCINSCTLHVCG